MWDKKEGKDVAPGGYATGTGYASGSQSLSNTMGKVVNIGQTIFIKGELTGTEDLTIEGRVEGKIELKDHNLTIGPNGKIKADVYAKSIVITGEVLGNAFASEKVEITNSGVLKGDISSPRIVIADGAQFKGSVDMDKAASSSQQSRPQQRSEQVKPLQSLKDDVGGYNKNVIPQQPQAGQADKAR